MNGKIVFITGGTSGYGRAMAQRFVKEGARVVIGARDECKLKATAETLGCDMLRIDVTRYEDWTNAKAAILEKYGRLDVLINNAGGGVAIREVVDLTQEEIDKTIRLNLNSVIYGANAFAKVFQEQRFGTIINLSSVCARECWPAWSVYAAAKAGVLNFSKGLYTELQPYGVRVSCLIPAAASTGFQHNSGIDEVQRKLCPEDIAETALFICKLPAHAVVEDITVWGIDQEVVPL